MAERVYELYRQKRMGKRTLFRNYQNLKEEWPLGALYLRFLFTHGCPEWRA